MEYRKRPLVKQNKRPHILGEGKKRPHIKSNARKDHMYVGDMKKK